MAPRIEAVMIVRDEADRLGSCLAALHSAVDGIVVLDTGSIDDTVDIAMRAGARVFNTRWTDDFAAARNAALQYCQADWAIQVDADEVLHDPGRAKERLHAFIETNTPSAIGNVVIESEFELNGQIDRARTSIARVFRPALYRYEGAIHEQIVPRDEDASQISHADTGLRFVHGGYAGDAEAKPAKARRNIPLLRKAMAQSPQSVYYPYQLGKTYFSIGYYAAAASALGEAYANVQVDNGIAREHDGTALSASVLVDLVSTRAYALSSKGNHAEARDNLRGAIGRFDCIHALPDVDSALGYVLLQLGQLEESEAAFLRARGCGPENEIVAGTGTFRAEYHLGLLREAAGDQEGALRRYANALHLRSDDSATIRRLAQWPIDYGEAPPDALTNRCQDLMNKEVAAVRATLNPSDAARFDEAWKT